MIDRNDFNFLSITLAKQTYLKQIDFELYNLKDPLEDQLQRENMLCPLR